MQIKWIGFLQIAFIDGNGDFSGGVARTDFQVGIRDDGVLVWKNPDSVPNLQTPLKTNDKLVQIGAANTTINDNPYNNAVMIVIK